MLREKEGIYYGKSHTRFRTEHEAILHVLTIVDKVVSTDTIEDAEILKFGNELIFFLKTFADKCHHGKEEDYLLRN